MIGAPDVMKAGGGFDYTIVAPDVAANLRMQATRIKAKVKATTAALLPCLRRVRPSASSEITGCA